MNKENFIAIILGLILGTVVAVGFWTSKNNGLKLTLPKFSFPNVSFLQKPLPTVIPTPTSSITEEKFFLNINSPQDDIIVNKNEIEISGRTTNEATIIISVDKEDTTVFPDSNGNFSLKISLNSGPNTIITTATDPKNNSEQIIRTIIFQEQK